MSYNLFLLDLDDTLLDFRASERLSFLATMQRLGLSGDMEPLFADYQRANNALWREFELGTTTKEHLKVERFRSTFDLHGVFIAPAEASACYLETLPQTVVLIEHAVELCQYLSTQGEIGIITNGIQHVQAQRIANSALAPFISFTCVSEACGFAKPDIRFFEYSATMAKNFVKQSTLIIGDRLDADIQGAHDFGVDACWFNPHALPPAAHLSPKYEIHKLSELQPLLEQARIAC